jgi:hypothetical protein
MVAGMVTGILAMIWVWWTAATAWTWCLHRLRVTFVTAVAAGALLADPARAAQDA